MVRQVTTKNIFYLILLASGFYTPKRSVKKNYKYKIQLLSDLWNSCFIANWVRIITKLTWKIPVNIFYNTVFAKKYSFLFEVHILNKYIYISQFLLLNYILSLCLACIYYFTLLTLFIIQHVISLLFLF